MRIGVAGASAGNAMLLAIALYCGAFTDAEYVGLFRWASVVASLPSIFWSAGVFYRGAVSSIRARTPHMDLPIAIGIAVGTASGIANTVRGNGEVYFDTITMVIFLLLLGRFLQHRQQRNAESAEDSLNALSPRTARLLDGDSAREVPVETVPREALVEVRSGEHVPVDGCIVSGASSIDVSLLTGESLPEEVGLGSKVHAGSVNLTGRIVIRADRTGRETRLAQLLLRVEEAAARRAPIVQLADRLSRYFVVVVLSIAAVTLAVLFRTSPALAVERAVALLVVTCPCALALATPLSITAALGRAARRGLMIKGGSSLEALARPALIVFDKTGTLTRGALEVVGFEGDPGIKPLVAAAEASSAHPIARALTAAFGASAASVVSEARETLGGGVEATVDGKAVAVGSPSFVGARARSPEWVEGHVEQLATLGLTPVLLAVDGEVRAVAAIGDPPRDDAFRSLTTLRELGYRLAILSGDQPAVVRSIAARIGVPFDEIVGGASPEAKLGFIEERVRSEPVFMVGDGVNDAAALSAATVGIAVHGGAEASLSAADVFATTAGLSPVVELVLGARRTLGVIRGNLTRSLVYNLTVGTLAALGFVGPLLAAVLMPVSSIGVITAAYRGRTFGEKP
jgi:Cu2+-exporting ATPase